MEKKNLSSDKTMNDLILRKKELEEDYKKELLKVEEGYLQEVKRIEEADVSEERKKKALSALPERKKNFLKDLKERYEQEKGRLDRIERSLKSRRRQQKC